MTRIRRVILSAVGLAVTLVAQVPPSTWQFGHSDAKLMLGFDVKAFRESSMWQSMRTQMTSQLQLASAAMPALPFKLPGMDFLDQIDRVFLSSPAFNTTAKAANAPFLVVIEGRFSAVQLKPFSSGAAHAFKGVEVRRLSKTGDGSIALLNKNTILLGDEQSLHAAIERRGQVPQTALLARAMTLSSHYDFWMIAADSLSKFAPASDTNPFAAQIEGLDMGLTAREGMELELNLNIKNEQAAQQFAQLLSSQLQLAMLAQADIPGAAEVFRKLAVRAEGKQMRVHLTLTKEEVEQQLRTLQSARAATPGAPTAHSQIPTKPGKVKIYGLDEGVREIQLTH